MNFKKYNNKITITFVGDIMQHPDQLKYEENNNFNYDCFSEIKHLLKGDIVVGNLETTFSGFTGAPEDRERKFNAPDAFAKSLKKAGFTHLVLLNNHTFDGEYEGFERTQKVISQAGMTPLINKSFINVKNQNVELINFTTHFNPSTVSLANRNKYKDYHYFNSEADIKIAFPHWGGQYNSNPDKEQLKIGKYLKDKGYTVVGSGPHTPHKTEDGIVYSLGDFISAHQKPNTTNIGKIVTIIFNKGIVESIKETKTYTETINGKSTVKIR